MTPLDQITAALNSLADLEHAAQDEDGRGGFTDDEIVSRVADIRTILETIQKPLIEQAAQHRPLRSYKQGTYVEVFNATSGDWTPGYVSEIDRSGHLHVETERGPLTIGHARRVRTQS